MYGMFFKDLDFNTIVFFRDSPIRMTLQLVLRAKQCMLPKLVQTKFGNSTWYHQRNNYVNKIFH